MEGFEKGLLATIFDTPIRFWLAHSHQRGKRDPHRHGPEDQGDVPDQTAKDLDPLPHARNNGDQSGLQDFGDQHSGGDGRPPSAPNDGEPDGPPELENTAVKHVSGMRRRITYGNTLTRFTDQILALRTPASQTIPGIHNSYPGRSVQEASITVYQRLPRLLVISCLESALTTRTGTM
jgi:hypothetical protein